MGLRMRAGPLLLRRRVASEAEEMGMDEGGTEIQHKVSQTLKVLPYWATRTTGVW